MSGPGTLSNGSRLISSALPASLPRLLKKVHGAIQVFHLAGARSGSKRRKRRRLGQTAVGSELG